MSKFIVTALMSGLLALAFIQLGSAPAADRRPALDDHEALEKCMKELKGAMRRMRRSVGEAEMKDDNLAQVLVLQKAFVAAKSLVPGQAAKSEKKDEMILKYRLMMLDGLQHSIELERAVLAGKADEAKAAIRALQELQDSGHSIFKVEDD